MKIPSILKKTIIAILIACFVIIASVYSCILYNAFEAHPVKSDAIIVLGCHIRGMKPSPMLKFRLEKALDLYKRGYADHIIVSGGKGVNEATYESSVMKNWLSTHGVKEDDIFVENKSKSTYENLKFSKKIADNQGYKSVIIVSNDFHIFRSLMIARKLHIKATGAPARTLWHDIPYYHFREVFSVLKNFALNRM